MKSKMIEQEEFDINSKVTFKFRDIDNNHKDIDYDISYPDCLIYDLNWLVEKVIKEQNEKLKNEEFYLVVKQYEKYKEADVEYKYPLAYYLNLQSFLCKMTSFNKNSNSIELIPEDEDSLGNKYKIKINNDWTVKDLINEIYNSTDLTKENKIDLYDREIKLTPSKKLKEYGIKNNSKIKYKKVPKIIGGGGTTEFLDVTNDNAIKKNQFVTTAPKWRTVFKGLNVEGICNNKNCEAYNKLVICPIGLGIFNINFDIDKIFCPMCHDLVDLETIGFTKCQYGFGGLKREGNKIIRLKNQFTPVGRYYERYDEKKAGTAKFSNLTIVAKENADEKINTMTKEEDVLKASYHE